MNQEDINKWGKRFMVFTVVFLVSGFILATNVVSKEDLYQAELEFCNGLSATPYAEERGDPTADTVGNIFRCGKCWDNTKESWEDPLDNALYVVCDYPFGTNEITTIGCGGDNCRHKCDSTRRYFGFMEKARYSKEYWRETWRIDNPYSQERMKEQ